jgi:UDPglucose 6-dehydrogenase
MINVGIIGCGTVGNAIIEALKKSDDIKILMSDKFKMGEDYVPISELKSCDIVFVAVPTPFDEAKDAVDLEPVLSSSALLSESGFKGILLIKSTIPPGTSEALSKKMGNARVVFSPEFLREETAVNDFYNQKNIIFGVDDKLREKDEELILNIFNRIVNNFEDTKVDFVSYGTSELVKYSQNVMFSSRIAICNIIYDACENFGVEYDEVKELAFYKEPLIGKEVVEVPGPDGKRGFGGKCLPKDTAGFNSFNKNEVIKAILKYNKSLGREIG